MASSYTETSTVSAVTHTIAVGKGGHTMSPDVTLAEVGGYIERHFYPTNQSVVRAEYKYPCIPYEMTGINKVGFFSGCQPVDAILSNPPKFTLRINDSSPIFFYCSAPNSCIGYEMVGVINPNASTSLQLQKQLAGPSTFMLQPGEDWPSEGAPSSLVTTSLQPSSTTMSTSTTSSTSTSVSSTAAGAATTTDAAIASSGHGGISVGGIAGIAIGAAAIALVAALAFYFCGRASKRQISGHAPPMETMHYQSGSYIPPTKTASVNGSYIDSMTPVPQMGPMQSPRHTPMPESAYVGPGIRASRTSSPEHDYSAPAYNQIHPNMYSRIENPASDDLLYEMPTSIYNAAHNPGQERPSIVQRIHMAWRGTHETARYLVR